VKRKESFVTNSSSTSYILVGKRMADYEVENEFVKKSTKLNIYAMSSYYCNEGADIFKLNKKMFDYIAKRKIDRNIGIEFYDVKTLIESEEGASLSTLKDFIDDKDVKLFGVDKDYHSTESLEDFIKRYVKYSDEED
jgi:hypothetical protein